MIAVNNSYLTTYVMFQHESISKYAFSIIVDSKELRRPKYLIFSLTGQ